MPIKSENFDIKYTVKLRITYPIKLRMQNKFNVLRPNQAPTLIWIIK